MGLSWLLARLVSKARRTKRWTFEGCGCHDVGARVKLLDVILFVRGRYMRGRGSGDQSLSRHPLESPTQSVASACVAETRTQFSPFLHFLLSLSEAILRHTGTHAHGKHCSLYCVSHVMLCVNERPVCVYVLLDLCFFVFFCVLLLSIGLWSGVPSFLPSPLNFSLRS